jgi:hypothetical protein
MPSITRIRVRSEDTDAMSVVYYGNYLTYFADLLEVTSRIGEHKRASFTGLRVGQGLTRLLFGLILHRIEPLA